ncbi:MAG: imidazoleglycerol-phosphate dehydratase HisB [Candidatus Omnitrophica bacterium]|nr:imidazoleglycerol-phosphate dehydratase HisB [Candidatus Omnitrophota bacterium]
MAASVRSKKSKAKKAFAERKVEVVRATRETHIRVMLNLDGRGRAKVNTGIPFLDHMLSAFAKHGLFDLELKAAGDLHIDIHHTNEDVGIAMGQAFSKALGDKKSIRRFGFFYVPLGDALTRVVVDISGRPYFNLKKPDGELRFTTGYDLPEAVHMLESFVQHAGIDTHIQIISGHDGHHVMETIFKAFGRATSMAVERLTRISDIPSTKGTL